MSPATPEDSATPPVGPRDLVYARLTWMAVALALGLRIIRYVHDHGLWIDEAWLALNIIGRSFHELTGPLDDLQFAPIGFLFVMKWIYTVVGGSDHAFRLFPFVGSIASVFLFYGLVTCLLRPAARPLAMVIFALSYPLLIYAAETKPYGIDAAVAAGIALAAVWYGENDRPGVLHALVFSAVGVVAVWLSFPSTFVLAGAGVSIGVGYLFRKEWRNFAVLSTVVVAWLASFAPHARILFTGSTGGLSEGDQGSLVSYFGDAFFPWPPSPTAVVEWIMHFLPMIGGEFTSEVAGGIGAFALIMGCIAMARGRLRELSILLLPLAAAIAVSATRLYPLTDRFTLFIAPAVLLVIAAGFDEVRTRVGRGGMLVWAVLVGIILFHPAMRAVKQSIDLERHGDARAAVAYLDEHIEPGDFVYLHWTGDPVYRLYSKHPAPAEDTAVSPRIEQWVGMQRDLDRLRGKPRVWLLYSFGARETPRGSYVYEVLADRGTLLDSFYADKASLALFDLSAWPVQTPDDTDPQP